MKKYLKKLPEEIQSLIYEVSHLACQRNISIYIVGGFVRDLLLGVRNLDLDFVAEGDAIAVAEDFAKAHKAKLVRHKRFGTATVVLESHLKVEGRSRRIDFASARKEVYPEPAHLPVVTFSNLKDDLFRRDFTVNALAINLSGQYYGKLVDFFKGKADLKAKKIRVMHDLSFIDDPTRILRAVRFEQRYGFRIEPHTLGLLKESSKKKMLEKLQPQRVRDELILTLKEEDPIKEIRRLQKIAGFSFIKPGLVISKRVYQLLEAVQKQILWFHRAQSHRRKLDGWLMYLAGVLDSLSAKTIKSICKGFAFRKGEEKRVLSYKNINEAIIRRLNNKNISPSRIYALLEPLSYEVMLLLKAKYRNKRIAFRNIENFLKKYNGMRISVTGEDLRRLGLVPGPQYHAIFKKVLNAKLDGLVSSREEELCLIQRLIRRK